MSKAGTMTHDETSKNHRGGLQDHSSFEKMAHVSFRYNVPNAQYKKASAVSFRYNVPNAQYGKALKLLAREGSRAQYEACGLATVGDQLLLKDVVCSVDEVPVAAYRRSKKPTVLEVKSLSPLDQRVYKAKRKAVSEAAIANWPGNEMPNFKKDPAAKEELENLVAEIVPKCSYEPAGFDKASIRQHILDVINERRRRHRNGHDYTQVEQIICSDIDEQCGIVYCAHKADTVEMALQIKEFLTVLFFPCQFRYMDSSTGHFTTALIDFEEEEELTFSIRLSMRLSVRILRFLACPKNQSSPELYTISLCIELAKPPSDLINKAKVHELLTALKKQDPQKTNWWTPSF
ncbi:hypothetical protein ACROYT_G014946 [Oculina patagonica]